MRWDPFSFFAAATVLASFPEPEAPEAPPFAAFPPWVPDGAAVLAFPEFGCFPFFSGKALGFPPPSVLG